jgi:anti-sigma factor RsiW
VSAHLSSAMLNGLADGELSAEQLAIAQEHLAHCPACTSSALVQTLLKTAVAKPGRRYAPRQHLEERLKRLVSIEFRQFHAQKLAGDDSPASPSSRRVALAGWAAAAVLLLAGSIFIGRGMLHPDAPSAESAALVTEVCDQHVATLAAGLPPQVISSDRHTVKPWFQGKLPFSFSLPDQLPADVKLEGANLTYLRNQPAAQLLYSIGRHRVSVLVRQNIGKKGSATFQMERSGFHIKGFSTDDLEVVAISDVEPARLSDLVGTFEQAQRPPP